MKKKCHNLRLEKNSDNDYYCGSTHVCYKSTCFDDMYMKVFQFHGQLLTWLKGINDNEIKKLCDVYREYHSKDYNPFESSD